MSLKELEAPAKKILASYERPTAAILPLLWLVQKNLGFIAPESEAWVAKLTGAAVVRVREVVTFYGMYRTEPAGKREIKVCNSLSCRLKGSGELLEKLEAKLGIHPGETTPDGRITLSEVECLCACELAPMLQLDEQFVGPIDDKTLDAVLAEAGKEKKCRCASLEPKPFVTSDGPVLSRHFGNAEGTWFDAYAADGGYSGAKKALGMQPAEVIDVVSKSNLRGLGGAGFPAGRKWSFIPKDTPKPRYLVVNGDEGEPGTAKDRYLLERDSHALIEGMIIAAYAIGAHKAYIYIRGEYFRPAQRMERAIEEAKAKGWLGKDIQGSGFDLEIVVHRGAGAYICGEETALLSSLEGGRGLPRIKPPFPAISGLFECPTIVNNVETLSCVPYILREGPEAFAKIGAPRQGGTRIFCVSGHVNRPGVYEAPITVTVRELIEKYGKGVRDGHTLKAVVPGGISAKILKADEIDVKVDFDSMMAAGTMAGSGGVIVMDETTCMVSALESAVMFYSAESCGQCTPCREGNGWIKRFFQRVRSGKGRPGDLDELLSIAHGMEGKTICVFADAASWPVQSYITKFREEFEAHLNEGRCPARPGAEEVPCLA